MESYEVGYKKPPKKNQFGQPNGNPMNRGWKLQDTARFKLEQIIKMSAEEVKELANDENAPLFERRIAKTLLKENEWRITESIINQVYGTPKQQIEQVTIEPPVPLSPRKQKKG